MISIICCIFVSEKETNIKTYNIMSIFGNSFVRQMGREVAHSTYKEMTSYYSELASIDEESYTTRLLPYNYGWIVISIIIAIFVPHIMVIPFIIGLTRIFSPKVIGHYRGTNNTFKYDGRCRGGKRYCGSDETWIKIKKSRKDCTDQQKKEAMISGIIEITISVITVIVIAII